MGPSDLPFASTLAWPAHIAKDIVEALVQDLKFRPGDFVYEIPLDIACMVRGLTAEEIAGGLEHAMERGWLVLDRDQRTYTLTQAGFAIV